MRTQALISLTLLLSLSACEGQKTAPDLVPAAKRLPVPAPSSVAPEGRTSGAVQIEQLARSLQTVEDFQQQVEQQIHEQNLEEELAKLEQELNGEHDP